jgi:hypothetical protein
MTHRADLPKAIYLFGTATSCLTDVNGADRTDTSPEALDRLLDDLLLNSDEEHASVSVTFDGIWNLELYRGRVVFQDIEERGSERHLMGVDRRERLAIATALIAGNLDSVSSRPWVPGYGT